MGERDVPKPDHDRMKGSKVSYVLVETIHTSEVTDIDTKRFVGCSCTGVLLDVAAFYAATPRAALVDSKLQGIIVFEVARRHSLALNSTSKRR